MADFNAAVSAVIAALNAATGVPDVPAQVPDQIGGYPYVIVYPGAGGTRKETHASQTGYPTRAGTRTIIVELHHRRMDLAADLATVTPIGATIEAALWRAWFADKFGGTVRELVEVRDGGIEALGGDEGVLTIGFRFSMDVVLAQEITP